jgi:hypothetical protein
MTNEPSEQRASRQPPRALPPLLSDEPVVNGPDVRRMGEAAPEPGSPSAVDGPAAVPGRRKHRRRRRVLAVALVLLGVFGAGVATSQLLLPRSVAAGPVTVLTEPPVGEASGNDSMPDVVGLDGTVARRVLRSHGIDLTPAVTSQPAAGRAGVVITQRPAPGESVAPNGGIEFVVSAATKIPDLQGKTLDEARNLIEGLGGSVTVSRTLDPASAPNTVLSTSPAADELLPENLTVTVADAGEGLPLASVTSVDSSSCSTTDGATLNGTVVQASVECTPSADDPNSSYDYEPASIEWAIGRHVPVLEFLAGADDSSGQGGGTITLYGDGERLAEVDVRFGATENVRVDVSGVLRLRIEVSTTSQDQPEIVLGDARLLGTRQDLEPLAGDR